MALTFQVQIRTVDRDEHERRYVRGTVVHSTTSLDCLTLREAVYDTLGYQLQAMHWTGSGSGYTDFMGCVPEGVTERAPWNGLAWTETE